MESYAKIIKTRGKYIESQSVNKEQRIKSEVKWLPCRHPMRLCQPNTGLWWTIGLSTADGSSEFV